MLEENKQDRCRFIPTRREPGDVSFDYCLRASIIVSPDEERGYDLPLVEYKQVKPHPNRDCTVWANIVRLFELTKQLRTDAFAIPAWLGLG